MPSNSSDDIQDISLELDIKNILMVDDDVELTDVLKALLESHNYVVTVVRNGVEALKEVMNFDFDAIICDMMMPTMPGDMFYLAVERTRPTLCERFIFVTAHQNEPKVEAFISKTKGMVLEKPFQIDELIRTLALLFRKTRARISS